jgi:hypothetical protein
MSTSCPSHTVNRMLTHLQFRSAMANRSFPAIDALIQQVEQSAADQPDALHLLGTAIKGLTDEAIDPYLLAGLLIEGAVHTVVQHIPPERQRDTSHALVHLLINRLMARGGRSNDRWS